MSRALEALGLLLGAVALVLAVPSDLLPQGWGVLGWLALIPVFRWTRLQGPVASALGGAAFFLVFALASCSWLWSFHPLAFPIVALLVAPSYALVFWLSHLLWKVFPRHGLWAQAALWTAFEWLRLQWWLAFPYGELATTQAYLPVLWQTADLVGTHGLTLVMALVACSAVQALQRDLRWVDAVGVAVLLVATLGYGVWRLSEPDRGDEWTVALVQNVQDPWKGGDPAYASTLTTLVDLSTEALAQHPDAVVWPETAFVPGIAWHTRYRQEPERWRLVKRLQDFLSSTSVPFVVGNDEGVLADDGRTRLDYNAALAWNGSWSGSYRKSRLVPFTESFPWREAAPQLARFLEDNGSRFWQPGEGSPVLTLGSVVVGTPICFEDAFSAISREFARGGARVLVNLTNDSWSQGTASREQHLAQAMFRAVETRLPLVRAANDGVTAAISSRGVVLQRLEVRERGVLTATVRLGSGGATWYTTTGDAFPLLLLVGLVAAVVWRKLDNRIDKGPVL